MKMQLLASSVACAIFAGVVSSTPASAVVVKPAAATSDLVLVRGGNPYGRGGMQGNSASSQSTNTSTSSSTSQSHRKKH